MDLLNKLSKFLLEVKDPSLLEGNKIHDMLNIELSNKEQTALLNYTGAMFRTLNPRLRMDKNASREDKTDLKWIDNAFSRSNVSHKCKVYRGISGDLVNELKNSKINSTLIEKAFLSATTDKIMAKNFARGSDRALLEIYVPIGAKMISIRNISQFKKENEVLINRGAKFKIIKYLKPTRTRLETFVIELLK